MTRTFAAPVPALFGILSDTNRFDRLSGVSPSRYTFELLDPRDPTSRTRIGHARSGPIPLHFAEEGEFWAGDFLHGERQFRGGFARWCRRGFLDVRCTSRGPDATDVEIRVGVEPTWIGWLLVPYLLVLHGLIVRRYLREVAAIVAATVTTPRAPADAPPAVHARYLLGAFTGETRASGRRTATRAGFAERARQFEPAPVAAVLRERVLALARDAPDEQVTGIHPLELANRWGTDGRETIHAFLWATRAGLFDLEWQVDCPTCRVGVSAPSRLDGLRGRIHCDECAISFDVDFEAHVHATFTINPAVRPVSRAVYCATSPYFRPHVHGYVRIEPGVTRDVARLPDGDILVRARGGTRSITVPRTTTGVALEADADGFRLLDDPVPAGTLRVANRSSNAVRLQVERAGWSSPRARGSLIMTIPGFVDLFGTDAPAAGHPIEVSRLAVLFTDLVGSVELYNSVGDARAYALVQEHWRDVADVVAKYNGSIVKTLGDGVFAAFVDLDDAIQAALGVMAAAERMSATHQLAFAIRAGCHEGPCFIIRANDRLDLFGTTVNLAARLSGIGGGQQLALLTASADPRRALLATGGNEVERISSSIKGVQGTVEVTLVTRTAPGAPRRLTRLRTDPVGMPALDREG
ncbi:MAG: DUF5939 domain-containing protein [Kofleriaceae bacterium]|nr:DUF5939 domain-containing protein [Kofleriaceae bacterium]